MKRMFYNIKGAFLALVLAGTMSCQNYLNLTDPESLSDGNFPTNIDHIGLIVNSVYGVQHHWYLLGNYWAGYVMYCLDHTIDMQWHNDQEWIDISAGEVKAGNVKVTDPWTGLSLGVYYANSALEKISLYRQNAQPAEAEALDNYEGECLFFRAFYWWHMWNALCGNSRIFNIFFAIFVSRRKNILKFCETTVLNIIPLHAQVSVL